MFWILVLIASAQKPRLNVSADKSSGHGGLYCNQRLCVLPYFIYMSSKGSDVQARPIL